MRFVLHMPVLAEMSNPSVHPAMVDTEALPSETIVAVTHITWPGTQTRHLAGY